MSGLVVYLNGEYMARSAATIPIDDRGFLFADACYEVTAFYGGRCLVLDRHLGRLQRGLDELRIAFDAHSLRQVHDELIARNDLTDVEGGSIYVQVTRGVAPRRHAFPDVATPTVLARASPAGPRRDEAATAITCPDERWGRVDIKTTGLLPNVLAQQRAVEAGVSDVILHRSGFVTEGSHTNVFVVIDGAVTTAPLDHRILGGVTRDIVVQLARAAGLTVVERTCTLDELLGAHEVFMTGTTSGVRAVTEVDGRPIGGGRPGEISGLLTSAYWRFVAENCGL